MKNLICKIQALLLIAVLCASIVVPHHHHGEHLCVANEWVDFAELTVEDHLHECADCGHTDCECTHRHHSADHDDDSLCQLNLKFLCKTQIDLTVYRCIVAVFASIQTISEAVSPEQYNDNFYSFAEDLPEAVALRGHGFRAPPFYS